MKLAAHGAGQAGREQGRPGRRLPASWRRRRAGATSKGDGTTNNMQGCVVQDVGVRSVAGVNSRFV